MGHAAVAASVCASVRAFVLLTLAGPACATVPLVARRLVAVWLCPELLTSARLNVKFAHAQFDDETQDEPERRKRVKVAVAGAVSLEVKPVV